MVEENFFYFTVEIYSFFCDSIGMEGVDKEKVQRIIYEMSKGSKYFENEEKKEAYMKLKIEKMRSRCAKLTDSQLATCQMVITIFFVKFQKSMIMLLIISYFGLIFPFY